MKSTMQLVSLLEGSLLADSLAAPVHWIYDPAAIRDRFGRVTELQEPPDDGYHAEEPAGGQTHYGAQALVLMEAVGAAHQFDVAAFSERWRAFWHDYPGYRDKATKTTLANLEQAPLLAGAGSDVAELAGAARIAPLLVAMAAAPEDEVIAAAKAQTAVTHNHPAVLDAAAFLVRAVRGVLADQPVPDALARAAEAGYAALPVAQHLAAARAKAKEGAISAVQALGPACAVNGAFAGTLALALVFHDDDLEDALIENAMAGGDSAARGLALGMILGARAGTHLPQRWLNRWQAKPRVEAFLAAQLPKWRRA